VGAIPLSHVGVGGNQKFSTLQGIFMGTVVANPYRLGIVTVAGDLLGIPSSLMGMGFDNRTVAGEGVLQLVAPTRITMTGALGTLASIATLSITIVPEPATALLVFGGLAALASLHRRNAAR
jgi:hypothetical protein